MYIYGPLSLVIVIAPKSQIAFAGPELDELLLPKSFLGTLVSHSSKCSIFPSFMLLTTIYVHVERTIVSLSCKRNPYTSLVHRACDYPCVARQLFPFTYHTHLLLLPDDSYNFMSIKSCQWILIPHSNLVHFNSMLDLSYNFSHILLCVSMIVCKKLKDLLVEIQ